MSNPLTVITPAQVHRVAKIMNILDNPSPERVWVVVEQQGKATPVVKCVTRSESYATSVYNERNFELKAQSDAAGLANEALEAQGETPDPGDEEFCISMTWHYLS